MNPLVRLRKMVAFERFLARLFSLQPDKWFLKGGLALQLRLGIRARTTKDMDMLTIAESQKIYQALRNAGRLDLGDWFAFEVARASQQSPKDFGGLRHQIRTLLDGRTFEDFHIDVGIGDPLSEPPEYLTTPDLLSFAGLEPTRVPCYPVSQQIAEKFHAYTRPRTTRESSRVKDFVDILLLAELGNISSNTLQLAILETFRNADTHTLPSNVPQPPSNWEQMYRSMADEVGLNGTSLNQAYAALQNFLDPVLRDVEGELSWDPIKWSWGQ